MNKVVLMGRLTKDPEIRYSTGENATAIARFTVAVNRKFKNAEGNYEADFINCVAFGKSAEFIEKYFAKGSMIALSGRIQTGSYTNKDGVKVYTTDVVVEDTEFAGGKNEGGSSGSSGTSGRNARTGSRNDDFMNIPDDESEELPFN